jgi:cytochrome c5
MRRIQPFPALVYGKPVGTAGNCVSINDFCVYNRARTALQISICRANAGKAGFFNCIKEIMSDAHTEHQSFIRTPKQLIAARLAGAGSEQSAASIASRVRPVADEGFVLKDANAPKMLQTGQAVYTAVCVACHGTGAAGAPKMGDTGAWSTRIGQGFDTLVQHAVQGIRAMPAKGGNPDLDDIEVARAVAYMGNQSGAKFKEPEAPAGGAVAAATMPAAAPAIAAAAPGIAATAPGIATPAVAATPPAAPSTAAASNGASAGKALYNSACVACHGAGIAGAPKFGDKGAWAPRIAQGNAVLYEHALKGFQGKAGVMPPKGGSSAPDVDVKAAVDYMTSAAK